MAASCKRINKQRIEKAMDKKDNYNDFLSAVNPDYQDWVKQVHEFLLKNECKEEVKPSKSGYLVTYTDKKRIRPLPIMYFVKAAS